MVYLPTFSRFLNVGEYTIHGSYGGGFSMAMSVLPEDIFPPLFCQMLHLATVDELRDMKKRSYFRGFFMEVMVFENLRFQAHDPNTRNLAKGFYVVVKM